MSGTGALADRLWLVVHGVAAAALTGSSTHLALLALERWRGVRVRARMMRLHARLSFVLWVLVVGIGAWVYPTYRVLVRANFLDAHAPGVSIAFDVKENVAVLAGPLLLLALAGVPAASDEPAPRAITRFSDAAAVLAALVFWGCTLTGLFVASYRGLGG